MRRCAAMLLAVALVACAPAADAAVPVAVDALELEIVMSEFAYSEQLIDVPAKRPLRILLKNDGKVDHDLVVDALRVRSLLRSNESAVIDVKPVPVGVYEVYCSIPTHRELGMVAILRAQ